MDRTSPSTSNNVIVLPSAKSIDERLAEAATEIDDGLCRIIDSHGAPAAIRIAVLMLIDIALSHPHQISKDAGLARRLAELRSFFHENHPLSRASGGSSLL